MVIINGLFMSCSSNQNVHRFSGICPIVCEIYLYMATAFNSRLPQEFFRPDGLRKLKCTILTSEWGSSKGGLSTINRELAIQLAKFPGVEITFFLPQCGEEDKKQANGHNVSIVEAIPHTGFDKLDWLSFPPEELEIDVVVGHGVILGRYAQVIRKFKKCKWVQVVHTDPEELGMYKIYANPISKGEEKHRTEVELCEMADLVLGVGPKLSEAFRLYLRGFQSVLDFTPGVFHEFVSLKQSTDERKHCSVLVFGRGDHEDFELKGFDIAGKAIAKLSDTHLVFAGAPDGKHEEIAERITKCGVSAKCLKVKSFLQSRESLKCLFQQVDLVLMPSRTEGFGLTGLEALSAGLPVLVSKNSGFGEALCKVRFGSSFVIDSEDPKEWAAAIKKAQDKGRSGRLQEAEALRTFYMEKYCWKKQCEDLLHKMINMVDGMSYGGTVVIRGALIDDVICVITLSVLTGSLRKTKECSLKNNMIGNGQ